MHKQFSPTFLVTFSRLRKKSKAYSKVINQWILYPEFFFLKSSSQLPLDIPLSSSLQVLPSKTCLNPAHEANEQSDHEQGGTDHPVGKLLLFLQHSVKVYLKKLPKAHQRWLKFQYFLQ